MGKATNRKRKIVQAFVPHADATQERLAKGDLSEYVNPAEIDPTEQAIGRVRRFRSSMLDRLHNNGQIDWPQWYAGDVYRNAYHRAAMSSSGTAAYGERTTAGECSYGLARTESQVRARNFLRQCREQVPLNMRGFMDRFLIHDDLPRYGGNQYNRTVKQIRNTLAMLADYMRIAA